MLFYHISNTNYHNSNTIHHKHGIAEHNMNKLARLLCLQLISSSSNWCPHLRHFFGGFEFPIASHSIYSSLIDSHSSVKIPSSMLKFSKWIRVMNEWTNPFRLPIQPSDSHSLLPQYGWWSTKKTTIYCGVVRPLNAILWWLYCSQRSKCLQFVFFSLFVRF